MNFLYFIFLIAILEKDPLSWTAQILDLETGQPVAAVHIRASRDLAVSDRDGFFTLKLESNMEVTITHVGYETLQLTIDPEDLPNTVFLKPLEVQLDEVEVTAFPSESEFKNQVLANPYIPTLFEQNLHNNLTYMKSIYKLAYSYDMSSYDVLLEKIRPSGGATFFTNTGGGLIQAFKDLKKPSPPNFPTPYKSSIQLSPSLIKRLGSPDSLKRTKDMF